jgi:DNA-binding GntR family transcriptional regulator
MAEPIRFESVTNSSIYVRVAEQIRDKILIRSLTSGQPLPAERALAEQFGAARTAWAHVVHPHGQPGHGGRTLTLLRGAVGVLRAIERGNATVAAALLRTHLEFYDT